MKNEHFRLKNIRIGKGQPLSAMSGKLSAISGTCANMAPNSATSNGLGTSVRLRPLFGFNIADIWNGVAGKIERITIMV
ncbi:MAG TPA: hypothetical protein ENG03_13070 [Thioploca sp.]|nr:hypothetical protein [Thioploca sp.]